MPPESFPHTPQLGAVLGSTASSSMVSKVRLGTQTRETPVASCRTHLFCCCPWAVAPTGWPTSPGKEGPRQCSSEPGPPSPPDPSGDPHPGNGWFHTLGSTCPGKLAQAAASIVTRGQPPATTVSCWPGEPPWFLRASALNPVPLASPHIPGVLAGQAWPTEASAESGHRIGSEAHLAFSVSRVAGGDPRVLEPESQVCVHS